MHTAHIVQDLFKEHDEEFKVLLWHLNSPNLNLTEHLCDVLDKKSLIHYSSTSQPTERICC